MREVRVNNAVNADVTVTLLEHEIRFVVAFLMNNCQRGLFVHCCFISLCVIDRRLSIGLTARVFVAKTIYA
jgi:hypothetical protein